MYQIILPFRKILQIGQRKKTQQIITQQEDYQEEQYFQNLEEQKQNEESVCFEFKRMRISDELDETQEIVGKIKKNKQQLEDFCYIYEFNHQKVQESINSFKSIKDNQKQEEIPENENTCYHQEVSQECYHIVKIDEINYINSLNFQKQIKKKTYKFKAKKLKDTNVSIKAKVISK